MTVLILLAGEAFGGERVLENTVRLITMLVGFPLAMIAFKFGVVALRKAQPASGWGALSYGFMALLPAVGRAMAFGNPVNWVTTGLYIAGLIAGGMALGYRATLSANWVRIWAAMAAWWGNRRKPKGPRNEG